MKFELDMMEEKNAHLLDKFIIGLICLYSMSCHLVPGMVGLAPEWVRLDLKLDKSATFSDQISVHSAR